MVEGGVVEETRKVSEIVYRDDLYPRIETSAITVQKYAEDLDVLPPIEINQLNELIDGWHRWTAHKKQKAETIRVLVTKTTSDANFMELAIQRNATHGLQLSQQDKRGMAMKIYGMTPLQERDAKKKELAEILSVSDRTIRDWLSRIDKDSKEARDRLIFDLWLSCRTQEEIAEAVGTPRKTVDDSMEGFGEIGRLAESAKAIAAHQVDFTPPIYNVWKQQEKTAGSNHFGNSEVRWLDNLLYLYTNPFDVVVDPFAGGGSTIDVCKKRFRRYFVSDLHPIVEREKEIRQHDITTGLLKPPQWEGVKLVYLDPPYWKQAEGQYSKDKTDLSNMDLETFNSTLAGVINGYAKKASGYIALIIRPTQWNAPDRLFTDHIGDMLRLVKHPVEMRYSVPYESQQCNAQMVEWAKKNRQCLVLTREIVVWNIK